MSLGRRNQAVLAAPSQAAASAASRLDWVGMLSRLLSSGGVRWISKDGRRRRLALRLLMLFRLLSAGTYGGVRVELLRLQGRLGRPAWLVLQ